MTSNKPLHVVKILDNLEKKYLSESKDNIPKQCGSNADPIFQDWRFGIICDTLSQFKERGLSKKDLISWKKIFPIIYPWDIEYDIFRQNVNRRFVIYPWAIVMCSKKEHVVKSFEKCLEYKLPLCIRSGAHCYEPYSLCDGIIIDQSRRTKAKINDDDQTITIEPGCLNGPTADLLSEYELVLTQGTCANVSLSGLTLGGGLGFTGRSFGLTCDNLLNIELVTADGKIIQVNKKSHPELFWAHQGGGGGNFGIVTSFTFKVHPINEVIIMELWWDIDSLYEVLNTWLKWGPNSDRRLTTELDIYALNKHNPYPYPLLITGLFIGSSRKELKKIIQPLLDLNPKNISLMKTTYVESARHFTYARFPPPFFKNKSTYIRQHLSKDVILTIMKYMKKAGPNDRLEFDGLGGAYDDKESWETAYPHRNALAWVQWISRWGANADTKCGDKNYGYCAWEDFLEGPKKIKWVTEFYEEFRAMAQNSVKGAYVNCPDSNLKDWATEYYDGNLEKLIKIKKKWDPKKVFAFPQGLSQLY